MRLHCKLDSVLSLRFTLTVLKIKLATKKVQLIAAQCGLFFFVFHHSNKNFLKNDYYFCTDPGSL